MTRARAWLRPAASLGWQRRPAGRVRSTIEKIARFAGVGLASSLLYALAVAAAASGLRIRPDVSALLAYAITIPSNFLLHRHFTFRSSRDVAGDIARYVVAQIIGIAVSTSAMAICVDGLGLPYGCGIAAAIVLVPVLTYLLLDHWVFAQAAAETR